MTKRAYRAKSWLALPDKSRAQRFHLYDNGSVYQALALVEPLIRACILCSFVDGIRIQEGAKLPPCKF
jgi:hypothetical protein